MNSLAQSTIRHRRAGRRSWFIAVIGIFLSVPITCAQTVRVAAASDLQFAMVDLVSRYQKQTGQTLSVTYGSSGNFYAEIQGGAPFDIFFSADVLYAQRLIDAHLADPGSVVTYARGQIVLWAPADAHLNLSRDGFACLRDPRVQRIAIANPDHAPYGRAAVAALQKAGLFDGLKSKLVYGENISQAAHFAQSGSAQVGILALSLALSPNMESGDRWVIPPDLYPPLDQAAVVLNSSMSKNAARAFLEFVNSEAGREILSQHGFTIPKPVVPDTQKRNP